MRVAGAVVLGVAVVGCGANGGDPVAGQQIPAAPDGSSPSGDVAPSGDAGGSEPAGDAAGSASSGDTGASAPAGDAGGSMQSGGGSGGGGGGSGDDHARKVGLPKSIRIPEIGEQAFKDGVAAACGSPDGAPDCLTVTYVTEDDPGKCGAVEWVSVPEKDSNGNGESIVQRGATITATVFTCPQPADTTTEPPPDDGAASASDTPAPETASP
jgi:hypothetical protein